MNFCLEALQANDGDCLLLHYDGGTGHPQLILIDGGPRGVYSSVLKKRFDEIRGGGRRLDLRMVIVSHIDADHITGIVDFFKELRQNEEEGTESDCRIRTLWHNSFEKLHRGRAASIESAAVGASLLGTAPAGLSEFAAAVVSSVPQGNQVRDYAQQLGIAINQEFDGALVCAAESETKVVKIADGLTFIILGPSSNELDDLEDAWKKAKSANVEADAQAADYLNRTVPNLSSIVILAEARSDSGDKPLRMLLTGDAGGDLIWDAIKRRSLAENDRLHVDLLKVQHHGSMHSVDQDFFEHVIADHYVISGNGKHGNPHPKTLEWLSAARSGKPFHAYLTNRAGAEGLTEALDDFLDREQSEQPEHHYHCRSDAELSIAVKLG